VRTLKALKPNRFYKVPAKSKVRRAHAPNVTGFRAGGVGKYTIVNKKGKTIRLTATVENKEFGFDVNLKSENGHIVGTVWTDNFFGWSNFHRMVYTNRGHNLGKLLFRLSEQEVKRRGGTELQIVSNQQDTVTTALSLGYKLTSTSEARVRVMLGILPTAKQPTNQQIINAFKSYAYRNFPQLKIVREIK
jgi:hypothetical protein